MKLSNNYKRFVFIPSILSLLFLTSCWSTNEIEDLGLILGVAVDLEEEKGQEGENVITLTNQLATSNSSNAGIEGQGTQQNAYKNVSETGSSLMEATRNSLLEIEEILLAHHVKVLVIGEELASTTSLQQTLDYFIREHEIRQSCQIFIAKERASHILETSEPSVVPSMKLAQMTKAHDRNSKILMPIHLSKLNRKIQSDASFLLQNVISDQGEMKFDGASVFDGKTKKLQGLLNKEEVEGVNWITGEGKGGLVKSYVEKKSTPIIYEILSMNSNIQPRVNGNDISFDVEIESEGRIGEQKEATSIDPSSNETLIKVEENIEEEVQKLVKSVSEKTQQEYQVDVLGFGESLRIEYPKVWEKVKKDWDKTFSEVPIQFNVNVTIKDYGTLGNK
ncbi:Ger(x)C family spore germination protein [Halobacillus sp. A5]|uniref:Ger(x)C family spore germination protein n=1 Tax=Halobacillus sp. A5 TaxID=2880263 RepID=UPI0020A69853|nr:Ger(x)C family spore germination protein [Halobacillus sp. A5]MCP3028974.1 Ger(x)C family spore germination protein [Halobacillus sp. A5]